MTQLFGMQAGQQMAAQQQQSQALASLAMGEGAERIKGEAIANKRAALLLQQQEMFNKMLQEHAGKLGGSEGGQGNTIAGQMDQMAEMALHSGMPQQAKEYAQTASTIRKNESTIKANQQRVVTQHAQLVGRLLQNVHDQESWNRANALYMMITGQPSPTSNLPYSPQLVKQLQGIVLTQKDQATIKADQARATEARAVASTDKKRVTEQIRHDQAMEEARRKEFLDKEGHTSHIPTAGDLKAVTDLINSSYDLDSNEQAHARVLARPIAERMQDILRHNPDMTQSEAARRAFQEAQRHNDFAGMQEHRGLPGDTPQAAMPAPTNLNRLVVNKWYKNARGGVALWNGKQFLSEAEVEQEQKK